MPGYGFESLPCDRRHFLKGGQGFLISFRFGGTLRNKIGDIVLLSAQLILDFYVGL